MTKQRHIEDQYFGTVGVAVTPLLLTGVSSVLARTVHPPQTVCIPFLLSVADAPL